jgi:hypothetical protein
MTQEATPHHRSLWALDWLNVLVADVQTGVGPYSACRRDSAGTPTDTSKQTPC